MKKLLFLCLIMYGVVNAQEEMSRKPRIHVLDENNGPRHLENGDYSVGFGVQFEVNQPDASIEIELVEKLPAGYWEDNVPEILVPKPKSMNMANVPEAAAVAFNVEADMDPFSHNVLQAGALACILFGTGTAVYYVFQSFQHAKEN